ncbi:uncharacterized protein LOC130805921 [Amaranthus tricolor]|uniref:uncharacterized protein LOC130805921 n=1 Tax=Amaranthus tricolor TaxID=29722 RepID=UPI002582A04E|nr:uncharacterized protein LOC130805921 [Amaranthus tricolor]
MAVAVAAGRSTFIRTLCKKPTSTPFSLRSLISPSCSSSTSSFFLRHNRLSPSSSFSGRLPRELYSLLPFHNAMASACLVSRLPDRPNTSAECRFANYVTPI